MKYTPVIGLEVHVELNTKSKMFCKCPADYFGEQPNTHTCPVCLGLPGALPYPNKQALENCIKIGLALKCKISKHSLFERKNYFYPDLPKGYQISQYRWPLCHDGGLHLEGGKLIRINRVHMEEDTGKLIHAQDGTAIDFNRSGIPLVEIVTEPDFSSSQEVKEFAQSLQQILRYLEVSNADMERGDLRLEANVSLRELKTQNSKLKKDDLPPYRVELKNINSFRFMQHAIDYEIARQQKALEAGKKLTQETRGWNAERGLSYLQRTKEEAHDYRYFPEPDIPAFSFSTSDAQLIKAVLPELPQYRQERFEKEYGISRSYAQILTQTPGLADYFEEAAKVAGEHGITAKKIADTIVNKKVNYDEILPAKLIEILKGKPDKSTLSEEELEKAVLQSIEVNKKAVDDYKKGKESALHFLLGQVMSKTRGLADPQKVLRLLEEKLNG